MKIEKISKNYENDTTIPIFSLLNMYELLKISLLMSYKNV